jgi:small GTP-binding protein
MVEIHELKRKICLLGDWGVGKTSLIKKFVFDQFDDKYISTLGTKVTKKRIKFKISAEEIIDMNILIWDIMGQEEFKKIQLMAYKNANGAILVCDITRRETLDNLKTWSSELFSITGEIPIIIMANKSDLKDEAKFNIDDLARTAQGFPAPHYMTSAKTGENVEEAFIKIGKKLLTTL